MKRYCFLLVNLALLSLLSCHLTAKTKLSQSHSKDGNRGIASVQQKETYTIVASGGMFSELGASPLEGSVVVSYGKTPEFIETQEVREIRRWTCLEVKVSQFPNISIRIKTSQGEFMVCDRGDCMPSHYAFNGNGSGLVGGRTFLERFGEGWVDATRFGMHEGQFRRSMNIPVDEDYTQEVQIVRDKIPAFMNCHGEKLSLPSDPFRSPI